MKTQIVFSALLLLLLFNLTLAQDSFAIRIINEYAGVKNDGQRNYVQVGWQTTIEKGFTYYELERLASTVGIWQSLVKMDTLTAKDTVKSYSFSDYPVAIDTYIYRIVIFLNDTPRVFNTLGVVTVSSLTGIPKSANQGFPAQYETIENYPNPFNPSTKISFTLPVSEWASVEIFDLLGKKTASITEGVFSKVPISFNGMVHNIRVGFIFVLCARRVASN